MGDGHAHGGRRSRAVITLLVLLFNTVGERNRSLRLLTLAGETGTTRGLGHSASRRSCIGLNPHTSFWQRFTVGFLWLLPIAAQW
jgi:hypothetical protein